METRSDIASPIQSQTEVLSPKVRQELIESGATAELKVLGDIWHGRASDGTDWKIDPYFKNQRMGNIYDGRLYATLVKADADTMAERRAYGQKQASVERLVPTDDSMILTGNCSPQLGKKLTIQSLSDAVPISSEIESSALDAFVAVVTSDQTRDTPLLTREEIQAYAAMTAPEGVDKSSWLDAIFKYATAHNSKILISYGALNAASDVMLGNTRQKVEIGRDNGGNPITEYISFSKEYVAEVFRRADISGLAMSVYSATAGRLLNDVLVIWDQESVQAEQAFDATEQRRKNLWGGIENTMRPFSSISTDKVQDDKANTIRTALQDPYLRASEITRIIAGTPLGTLFDESTGVWEGYTLAQHTEAVLGMFESHYAERVPAATIGFLRTALFMHDIGKPLVRQGKFKDQATANIQTTSIVMQQILGYDEAETRLVTDLTSVGGKLYSDYIRFGKGTEELQVFVTKYAKDLFGKDSRGKEQAVYTLLGIYYNCDAGAYTGKARYKKGNRTVRALNSLDHVFEFAPDGMHRMRQAKKSKFPVPAGQLH